MGKNYVEKVWCVLRDVYYVRCVTNLCFSSMIKGGIACAKKKTFGHSCNLTRFS